VVTCGVVGVGQVSEGIRFAVKVTDLAQDLEGVSK